MKKAREVWFQKEVKSLLAQDSVSPPPRHAVLFTGSSILRCWATLQEDMSPIPVINRAFGGARTWEVLYYMDRIVLPYSPSIVVYYCGSNDIEYNASPDETAGRFEEFCCRVHAQLPTTRVLYLSIIKAPQKIEKWRIIDTANDLIRTYCTTNAKAGYIDINPALFTAEGEPCCELYISDGLHLVPEAYRRLTDIIKPALDSAWRGAQTAG